MDTSHLINGTEIRYILHDFSANIPDAILESPLNIVVNLPVTFVLPRLSRRQLVLVAAAHKIEHPSKATIGRILHEFKDHVCDECADVVTVFLTDHTAEIHKRRNATEYKRRGRKASERERSKSKISGALKAKRLRSKTKRELSKKGPVNSKKDFPPHPPSKADQHRIISGMCNDFDPANFEECGCSVCGELVPKIELTRKVDLPDLNYEVLCENGVTRKERFSENDPVEELEGPIFADDCDHVCVECESFLRKGKRPLKSLANYLWVGKIPWQLADLSWAEKMLIARVSIIDVLCVWLQVEENLVQTPLCFKLQSSKSTTHCLLAKKR
ncbi:hypothetical protein C8R43DRAFT_900739 [Mycena crocata]|nr:hypothetical protein C8R43DRAFT_900739 [Mycena crocata]